MRLPLHAVFFKQLDQEFCRSDKADSSVLSEGRFLQGLGPDIGSLVCPADAYYPSVLRQERWTSAITGIDHDVHQYFFVLLWCPQNSKNRCG